MPAWLRARVSRLGVSQSHSPGTCYPPAAGSPETHAEVICHRCRRYNYGLNIRWRWCTRLEAIGQRLQLGEGTSPREIKPPRCISSELPLSCCCSVAALPFLAKCNEHVAEENISRPRPPTPSALCTAPSSSRGLSGKKIILPFRIQARAPPAFLLSHAKHPHEVSCVSPLFPAPFLPRALRFKAFSPGEIFHMYAGQ
jgi:hypothetical protein